MKSAYRTKHWNHETPGKLQKGSGKVRKYRGKRVLPGGLPRANTHGGHSIATAGFEVGAGGIETRAMPGRFKVSLPTKRHHRRGIVRSARTGERVL